MEEKEANKSVTKIILMVVIAVIGIFLIARLGNRLSGSNRGVSTKKNIEADLSPIPGATADLKKGETYIARTKEYKLNIGMDLTLFKLLMDMDSKVVFAGLSKQATEDKASFIVRRISTDNKKPVMECWNAYQDAAVKANPRELVFEPTDAVQTTSTGAVFNIRSKDGVFKGKLKLIKRGETVYEIRGTSSPEKWSQFEAPFSEMMDSFTLLR